MNKLFVGSAKLLSRLAGLAAIVGLPLVLASAVPFCASATPGSNGSFHVLVRNGRLSVSADDVPMSQVLDEISGQANVPIVLNEGVGSIRASFHLDNVSLLEGLQTVLRSCDSFFLYSPDHDKPAGITAVWVYPAGHGRTLQPVAARPVLPLAEIESDLKDPDPQIRIKAVAAMIDRGGRRALNAVIHALNDPNDQVRSETLYSAWAANLQLPESTLQMLALGDRSPTVRFLALQSLANSATAKEIAQHALADPDVNVQNEARAVLDEMKSKTN